MRECFFVNSCRWWSDGDSDSCFADGNRSSLELHAVQHRDGPFRGRVVRHMDEAMTVGRTDAGVDDPNVLHVSVTREELADELFGGVVA